MKLLLLTFGFALILQQSNAQDRLPIIDMHLHAMAADAQGPPPLAMCTSPATYPAWDPAMPYGATFMAFIAHLPSNLFLHAIRSCVFILCMPASLC